MALRGAGAGPTAEVQSLSQPWAVPTPKERCSPVLPVSGESWCLHLCSLSFVLVAQHWCGLGSPRASSPRSTHCVQRDGGTLAIKLSGFNGALPVLQGKAVCSSHVGVRVGASRSSF